MAQRGVVSIARCPGYDPDLLQDALDESLRPLGGMQAFVRPGDTVFLKVNLLSKAQPDRAVTTHPALVRAVARSVLAAGGVPAVGDSPGGRNSAASARQIFEAAGLASVAEEDGIELVLLDDDTVRVQCDDKALYSAFTLGRRAVEAHVLIDLPKFKTHGFMTLTGGVKNLFGCIPGVEKAQFHVKVPERTDFADMLVDLALTCRPELTIMDAVVGMEGEGPAGGSPRHIGALLASPDVFALDAVMTAMAGLSVDQAPVAAAAARRGVGPSSVDEVDVTGVAWRDVAPPGFVVPRDDLSRGMPPWLVERIKGAVTARPHLADPSGCTACGTCATNCPAGAIRMSEGRPVIDYDKCIRCYCCAELCPPQVVRLKRPWLARVLTG